jgi:hypothetical protein
MNSGTPFDSQLVFFSCQVRFAGLAPTEQLLDLWMTRVGLRRMVRLRYKVGLE